MHAAGCRQDSRISIHMWTKRGRHFGAPPEELTQLVNRATTLSEPVYKFLQIQTQLTAFVNTKEGDRDTLASNVTGVYEIHCVQTRVANRCRPSDHIEKIG